MHCSLAVVPPESLVYGTDSSSRTPPSIFLAMLFRDWFPSQHQSSCGACIATHLTQDPANPCQTSRHTRHGLFLCLSVCPFVDCNTIAEPSWYCCSDLATHHLSASIVRFQASGWFPAAGLDVVRSTQSNGHAATLVLQLSEPVQRVDGPRPIGNRLRRVCAAVKKESRTQKFN